MNKVQFEKWKQNMRCNVELIHGQNKKSNQMRLFDDNFVF